MILALLSFGIAAAVGLNLGLFIYKYSARRGWPKLGTIAGWLLGCVVFFPLSYGLLGWLDAATTTTLIDMDPGEGERQIEFIAGSPRNTSDFCYRQSYNGPVLADFNISEADFLAWMESQNLEIEKFELGPGENYIPEADTRSEVFPVRTYEDRVPLKVKRGYCYYDFQPPPDDISVTKIIYDLDSGRAYVFYNYD